jgi:hypothetical protein
VTLTRSAINNNFVNNSGTALGGGIDCENSTLSLTDCVVIGNGVSGATALGGGIYALSSTVTLTNCLVTSNVAFGTVLGEGGGIYRLHGSLTLINTIVQGNQASTAFDDIFSSP